MEITIPVFSEFSMKIVTDSSIGEGYPTARLQKGLLLDHNGQELAEEGVGFGVPVLKRGIQTIFPGSIELTSLRGDSIQEVTAKFRINLEEKIARPGFESVKSSWLYAIKNSLAALIRHLPLLRGLLTAASNALRWIFGWETTFEDTGFCTNVKMIYAIDSQSGIINVEVDTTGLSKEGITEIVVMNEQGARHFDLYRDSNGNILHGKEIGCWDEVTAESATFISKDHKLAFTLRQVNGAKLYRGRELIGSRLAWSGFGYSFPPTTRRFNYTVRIEKLP